MGFKDINYDTPVCRECHEGHDIININAQRTQHVLYLLNAGGSRISNMTVFD